MMYPFYLGLWSQSSQQFCQPFMSRLVNIFWTATLTFN